MINAYIAWGFTASKAVKLAQVGIIQAFVFDIKSTNPLIFVYETHIAIYVKLKM